MIVVGSLLQGLRLPKPSVFGLGFRVSTLFSLGFCEVAFGFGSLQVPEICAQSEVSARSEASAQSVVDLNDAWCLSMPFPLLFVESQVPYIFD